MASLNTLRTKFGVVLSIVIGLALLAFVLSLKTEMGFSGNDPKVGVIDGDKIHYSEYLDEYETVKAQMGAAESTEEQLDMISNGAWQGLISKHVLLPGFEKLGIVVTEDERKSIISGEIMTQAMYSAFSNRQNGSYDVSAVSDFLAQAETNAQAAQMWSTLVNQAQNEREITKYLSLIKAGTNVNSLEVANGVAAANKLYSGHWASKQYSTIPDSLLAVTPSETKAYYAKHKESYKQQPNRTLSYVVFEVAATDNDMLAIEKQVREVDAEFAVSEDLSGFIRKNRNGTVGDRYLSAKQLSLEEAEALGAGREYGPVLKNNVWTMSRVMDTKIAPDSIGVRHLAVAFDQSSVADSLANLLQTGADFATVSAGGGEERVYPFSAFTEEFIPQLVSAKVGDVVKIQAGNAIHIMQVYRVDAAQKHYRIATMNYPVEASAATKREIHNNAGIFMANAVGSVEKFNEAATTAAVTPRVATLTQGERDLRGMEKSRELVHWAYGAKEDQISDIFNVGSDYVIAMVTNIDDKEYTPIDKIATQLQAAVLKDKKYDYIVSKLSGSTLSDQARSLEAEVAPFDSVSYRSFFAKGIGIEPRVIGAIATAEQGVVAAPVKGNTGLFIFQLESVIDKQTQTPEAERVRAQSMAENMVQQASFSAIQQMAEIKDLRGKYFQ
ncbi:MAG: peptidylprolyl isomerase [Alistipes sp.]